jgi:homoserine dehydrogenase
VSEGHAFSAALSDAIALGYAEPDPSADLGGRDVARKAVILSRAVGWPAELSDVERDGLVPDSDAYQGAPSADYSSADRKLKELFADADCDGIAIRYLAQITPERISVGLARIDLHDPFAALAGTENRIAIHTRRYPIHPLAIAGPGAGPETTAAGVLSDLIDLAEKSKLRGENPCPC